MQYIHIISKEGVYLCTIIMIYKVLKIWWENGAQKNNGCATADKLDAEYTYI